MFEYIGGAVAIGLVIWMLNRTFTVRLDLNKQEDQVVLRSLYAIAQGMDGPADRLQNTLVKVVREALGQPEMDEEHTLEDFSQPRQLSVEKARGLSWRKRVALLVWAYRIKCGDEPMDSDESDRWLEKMSRTLDLGEEEVKALFETLEELSDNEHASKRLPLLKKGGSPSELALNVLGLKMGATNEQIDEAFQKKRMAAHPDRERDPEKKKSRRG